MTGRLQVRQLETAVTKSAAAPVVLHGSRDYVTVVWHGSPWQGGSTKLSEGG